MGTPTLSPRLRLLRVLRSQPHRYSRLRWITQGLTLLVLCGVPLAGLARLDLWGGRHVMAGRAVGPVVGWARSSSASSRSTS